MDFLLQSMEKMIFLHGKSFSPFFFAKTERILHVRRQMVHGRMRTEKRRGKDAYEKSFQYGHKLWVYTGGISLNTQIYWKNRLKI